MRSVIGHIALALALALLPAGAEAADSRLVMLSGDQDVHWSPAPDSLPQGMTISILSGNPDQPGPFTLRLRMPPQTVIAPHTHATAETVTVLSGSIEHETGPMLIRSKAMLCGQDGFVFLPAMTPHSLWTNGQPAEIQVNGTGPFGLHYVNPQDDPRHKPH